MIEPELFNFKPPVNKHDYVQKHWDKLLANIDECGLTHSISVVLPDTIFIPNYIENIFAENGQYYLIKKVTLCSLIDPGFITSFVKNGNVYAISLNTHIDAEDCISITNRNLLQMSLIQSSYQNMCLPAKDSKITLDLKELKFSSKSYQRIKESFERFQTKFDMLISWESNNDDVCPSSIASYFNKNGFDCQGCIPRSTTTRKYNMTIPTGIDNFGLLDTWLSYFSLDINIDDRIPCILPDGKLTKSNSRNVGQVTQIVWTGFFDNQKVKLLLEKFKEFQEKEGKIYWMAIHLEPFTNSPYPYTHRTIVLNPDNQLILDDCRSTAIVGLTDEYIGLRNLSIINVGLTSLKGFPALPSLVFLDVSENRISNSLQNLSGCTNLKSLNLSQNKLKDIEAIDPLKSLKRLKYLDLSNNEVTKEEGYKEYVIEYFAKSIKCLDGDTFFNGKHESASDSDDDSESEAEEEGEGDDDDDDEDDDDDDDDDDVDEVDRDEVEKENVYTDDQSSDQSSDQEYENGEGGLEDLLKDNIDEESEGNDYVLDEEDGVDQDSTDESDDDAGEADDTTANDSENTRGKKRKLDE